MVSIRAASPTDAHAIAHIHVAGWRSAYRGIVPQSHLDQLSVERRENYWASALLNGHPNVRVADSGSGILGWVAFDQCRDADKTSHTGELWAIYLLPEVLGQGIGRELWLRSLNELQQLSFYDVTLWVLAQNARARQFYESAGFIPDPDSARDVAIGGSTLRELRYARNIAA